MSQRFYAHSKDGQQPENWQRLEDHLKNVTEMVGLMTPFELKFKEKGAVFYESV